MKKYLTIALLAFAVSLRCMAALDTYTGSAHKLLFSGNAVTNSTVLTTQTGADIDISAYKGNATLCVTMAGNFADLTNRIGIVSVSQTNTVSGGWVVYRSVTNSTDGPIFTRIPFDCGKGGKILRCGFTQTNGISSANVILNAH